jgi:hypothetical protein
LSKDPFKPVRRSRVGHLMISKHLQQCLLGDLYICQPRVLERRSGLLDHLTFRFIVSFSTECGMFFIYRRCTPPDRLYGITNRSISVDRGLYEPIGVGCMALQTVRSVLIAVCTSQLAFRRCSPSIFKK